jgi:hypothetical protein
MERKGGSTMAKSLSVCLSPLPPTCLVLTVKEARSYFASTINVTRTEVRLNDINVFFF